MLIAFLKVVAFVKSGSKKKKITKAERLKQLQEEEKRQKEEGMKYRWYCFQTQVLPTKGWCFCNPVNTFYKQFSEFLVFFNLICFTLAIYYLKGTQKVLLVHTNHSLIYLEVELPDVIQDAQLNWNFR